MNIVKVPDLLFADAFCFQYCGAMGMVLFDKQQVIMQCTTETFLSHSEHYMFDAMFASL